MRKRWRRNWQSHDRHSERVAFLGRAFGVFTVALALIYLTSAMVSFADGMVIAGVLETLIACWFIFIVLR